MTRRTKEVEIRKCDWCGKEVADINKDDIFIGWTTLRTTSFTTKRGDEFVNYSDTDFCGFDCLYEYVAKVKTKIENGV